MSKDQPFYDYARDENPSVLEATFEWKGRTYTLAVNETHEVFFDDTGKLLFAMPKDVPADRAMRFLRWAGKRRQEGYGPDKEIGGPNGS